MKRKQPMARLIVVIVVAQLAFAAGCDRARAHEDAGAGGAAADVALRERDAALLREVDALTSRCATAWRRDAPCVEQACRLRTRELALFAEVRSHEFSDITESNYWHRGRLKFPSDLEQVLRRLAEQSGAVKPPCAAAGSTTAGPSSRR